MGTLSKLLAVVGFLTLGCTPAMFGQTDSFGETLKRGCSTVDECDRLVEAAERRNDDCAPNTMGKVRCSDTWKDFREARALQEAVAKKAEVDKAAKKQAADEEEARQEAPRIQADQEARQKRARAIADEEIQSGRCHDSKVSAFRQVVAQSGQLFSGERNAVISTEAHTLIVATKEGVPFKVDTGLGGEYHVMAFSFAPVKLTVKDAQNYEVKDGSQLADAIGSIFMPIAADGRSFVTNPTDTISASVTGIGCTLVMVMHRTPF